MYSKFITKLIYPPPPLQLGENFCGQHFMSKKISFEIVDLIEVIFSIWGSDS